MHVYTWTAQYVCDKRLRHYVAWADDETGCPLPGDGWLAFDSPSDAIDAAHERAGGLYPVVSDLEWPASI